MTDYLRWRTSNVKEALKTRRVVVISGARQTGKTTLAKEIRDKNSVFMPLDKKNILAAALEDPIGFVKNESGTMIIDENPGTMFQKRILSRRFGLRKT